MKEPKYTCPLIDDVIAHLQELHSSSLSLLSLLADIDLPPAVYEAYRELGNKVEGSYALSGWNSSGYLIDKMEAIRESNSELRSWGSHYKEKYEEIEDIESEVEGLKEEVADLQIEVRDLENENYSLTQENKELQKEILDLQSYVESEGERSC